MQTLIAEQVSTYQRDDLSQGVCVFVVCLVRLRMVELVASYFLLYLRGMINSVTQPELT